MGLPAKKETCKLMICHTIEAPGEPATGVRTSGLQVSGVQVALPKVGAVELVAEVNS